MEDAATVEIARSQIWQWIHHPEGILSDGRDVTIELVRQLTDEELAKLKTSIGEQRYATRRFDTAHKILDKIISSDQFVEFLTLPAYEVLCSEEQ
jgi:malate synthase